MARATAVTLTLTLTFLLSPGDSGAAGGRPIACYESGDSRQFGPCKSPDPVRYFPPVGALPGVIVANFGLLLPSDPGPAWQYSCDDAFGQPDALKVHRSSAGDIFLPTTQGLLITRDGCTFTAAAGDITRKSIIYDVASDATNPQLVFAIGDTPRVLWRSSDGGQTFATVARFPDGLALLNVVLPAGRSKQVYVIGRGRGTSTPVGFSNDDGVSFTMRDPGLGAGDTVKSSFEFLSADPISPDVLYFTLLEPDGDRLWRSSDGGTSVVPLLKLGRTEGLSGLTFGSAPGTVYLAAEDLFPLAGSPPGQLYISRDSGQTWLPPRPAPEAGPQFNCLIAAGAELFACSTGQGRPEDFLLARSTDEGQTWTPVTRLGNLAGPKACVAPQCEAVSQWLCDTYTSCAPGQEPTPNGLPDAASDAGPSDAAAPPAPDAGPDGPSLPEEDSGCACHLGRGGSPGSSQFTIAALLSYALARRLRRR
jgi:hypothetical protein